MSEMTRIDIDESLREQSKLLLRKLKDKQGRLQNIVKNSSKKNESSDQSGDVRDSSLRTSVDKSARQGKASLQKLSTSSKSAKERENYVKKDDHEENLQECHKKRSLASKNVEMGDLKMDKMADLQDSERAVNNFRGHSDSDSKTADRDTSLTALKTLDDVEKTVVVDCDSPVAKDRSVATPNTVRRRRIIDRNVRVGPTANLDESTLLRECEEDYPKLNFSYSNTDDTDLLYLKSRLADQDSDGQDTLVKSSATGNQQGYTDKLENPGNSRKIAKFIRETNKPKSILLSTSQRQNKSNSRVSFRSPSNATATCQSVSMNSTMKENQRMLGYDWIAALLENDPNAVNQSETFFEDLREFRRVNRQECVNQIYMDGPTELWEHPEREPEPVARALADTKVKPYRVNDRLFTEPIKRSMFADYESDEEKRPDLEEKTPTYEEPRFVRVSVPRSTLQSPHRVKPHRRKSFDSSDSMALSEHCLKGWDTSQPTMMPSASNIGLRDSTLGVKSTIKTTLDNAEKLAANYPYPWNPAEQRISQTIPKPAPNVLRSSYMDSTWPYNSQAGNSTAFNSTQGLKQATDDLLNSTYSLMYEMQKLKNDRDADPPIQTY